MSLSVSKSNIPEVLNFRNSIPLAISNLGKGCDGGTILFSDCSDTVRIRNQENHLSDQLYTSAVTFMSTPSLYTIPGSNFSVAAEREHSAANESNKWWSLPLARTKDSFDPGGEAPSSTRWIPGDPSRVADARSSAGKRRLLFYFRD